MSSSILAVALAGAFAAIPDSVTDPVTQWVAQAGSAHPEMRSARENLLAAQATTTSARSWMPPNSQFLYKSDGTKELSLSQMIPGPGKTESLVRIASRRIEMARSDSCDQARKLELSIRESAWMEWMAWRKIGIFQRQESLAVRLAESSRRLQAQGMATASEAWLADAKVRQARIDIDRARAEAASATAMRTSWTGPSERFEAPAPIAPDWDDTALAKASENRSDILSMKGDAAMQQAMGAAMRTGSRPDIMVGGMVMQMPNGMPGWGAMVGMTLPFVPWASGMASGEEAGAKARARAIQARAQTMARMARAEVADHAAKARSAWTALAELDTLLPQQERAVADAVNRYAQGREMLTMAIQMEDMATMTRMEAVMRRGEYELERARLLAAAGLSQLPSRTDAMRAAPGDTNEVTP